MRKRPSPNPKFARDFELECQNRKLSRQEQWIRKESRVPFLHWRQKCHTEERHRRLARYSCEKESRDAAEHDCVSFQSNLRIGFPPVVGRKMRPPTSLGAPPG